MPSNRGRMNRGRQGTRRPQQGRRMNRAHPEGSVLPVYKSVPIQERKFRFQCSVQNTYAITRLKLLGLYAYTTSSSAAVSAFAGIRVKRVQITTMGNYNSSSSSLEMITSTLEWFSEAAPSTEIACTGNAMNFGRISAVPPPGSLCAYWSGFNTDGFGTADPLFGLTVNVGDIIDIIIEYVPENGTPTVINGTGFPTNEFVYGHLDGPGGSLIPEGNVAIY